MKILTLFFLLVISLEYKTYCGCPEIVRHFDPPRLNQISDLGVIKRHIEHGSKPMYPYEIAPNIYARLIRGNTSEQLKMTSNDPQRQIVFFSGPKGIPNLIAHSNHKELARTIGLPSSYVKNLKGQGYQFKLLLLKTDSRLYPATWENITLLISNFSRRAAQMARERLSELRDISFDKMVKAYPKLDMAEIFNQGKSHSQFKHIEEYRVKDLSITATEIIDMGEVFSAGRSHKDFMTLEKFIQSNGTIHDVRSFLFHEFNLNAFFAGDGYTRTVEGSMGVPEFVGPNVNINSFKQHQLVDLDI